MLEMARDSRENVQSDEVWELKAVGYIKIEEELDYDHDA
jgi:hypothetical protein